MNLLVRSYIKMGVFNIMRKFCATIVSAILIALSFVSLVGCNQMLFDTNLKLNYILIDEGSGIPILHEIQSWDDSDSDSIAVKTKCCNNYIWTTANKAIVYRDFPSYLVEGEDYILCK